MSYAAFEAGEEEDDDVEVASVVTVEMDAASPSGIRKGVRNTSAVFTLTGRTDWVGPLPRFATPGAMKPSVVVGIASNWLSRLFAPEPTMASTTWFAWLD